MKEIITQKPTQKPKPLPKTKRVRKPIALPNSGDQYCRITPIILKVLVLVFIATIYFCQIHIIKRDISKVNDSSDPIPISIAIPYYKCTQSNNTINVSVIQASIRDYNAMQVVLNQDQFGTLDNDSVIIVIQVHTRLTYLRHLIESLALSRNIESSLLIFSHDFYDEQINDLVQNISFCKVMQIFYPHSIQTHPNEFPGTDPGDCPRNIKRDQAIIQKCNSAQHPDQYGHYREAKFTQIKHHWWWKANRVFDQLNLTSGHQGMFLFLEEDHYVAVDFLHMLKIMAAKSHKMCPACNVLVLGTDPKYYTALYTASKNENQVTIGPWMHTHNMGFALNRSTWREITACTSMFCSFDDYNWDWSLQYVSQQCMQHKLLAMLVKSPRVFHIGGCGIHTKKRNCDSSHSISLLLKVSESAFLAGKLFPPDIYITSPSPVKKTTVMKGYGGWADYRDHRLCQNMTDRH